MKLSVEAYLKRKSAAVPAPVDSRGFCFTCRKPELTCYCASIVPFESDPRMIILMHPHEVKKPIGTGRMSHQCLKNSELWIDTCFDDNDKVNALISDPKLYPLLLFPGPHSTNLTTMNETERAALRPADREPVIIVLDATWNYAKKMLFHSQNLQKLPRICFNPPHLSRFLVRKQPHDQCFSTIEAIHEIINLIGDSQNTRAHDHLIEVFDKMVSLQLSFKKTGRSRHFNSFVNRKRRRRAELAAQKNSDAILPFLEPLDLPFGIR